MTPEAYFQAIKARLLSDPKIVRYHIVREQFTLPVGQLRVRLTFIDGSWLEFSEFVRNLDGEIIVVDYSYHWMSPGDHLRLCWDNARHYPDLPNFPHHLHDGDEKNVLRGEPMTLFKVLDRIAAELSQ